MTKHLLPLLLLACSLIAAEPAPPTAAGADSTTPPATTSASVALPADLVTQINGGITMLTNAQKTGDPAASSSTYKTFLESFCEPKDLAQWKGNGDDDSKATYDARVGEFATSKAATLLSVLTFALSAPGSINDAEQTCTITLPPNISSMGHIVFLKVEGHWYIRNH